MDTHYILNMMNKQITYNNIDIIYYNNYIFIFNLIILNNLYIDTYSYRTM